jgi:2-C-methyl-D-erythritol 4-phosphate cytidylyltransferase
MSEGRYSQPLPIWSRRESGYQTATPQIYSVARMEKNLGKKMKKTWKKTDKNQGIFFMEKN